MDIDAFISSGILENYCLGFCDPGENALVEQKAAEYPVIKNEIERINHSLENHFLQKQVTPSPAVKIAVMLSIYQKMSIEDASYAPLIDEQTDLQMLASWIPKEKMIDPVDHFDNLFITELASTEQVTNFIVHAKCGHETEMHTALIEYLYIVRGSCTMDLEGIISSYKEGDIIKIGKHINHSATVTSLQPMIALVQRQACA